MDPEQEARNVLELKQIVLNPGSETGFDLEPETAIELIDPLASCVKH